jgi:hypothetical protein
MHERSPQQAAATAHEPEAKHEVHADHAAHAKWADASPATPEATEQLRTASQIAFEDDDNARELKQKVSALVERRFAGDYKRAFEHYDADADGGLNKDEIKALLSDAGIGNGLTRGAWVSGILKKLDSNGDAKIEWSEFASVARASA